MSFDVNKWNKRRYLAESNLLESPQEKLAKEITQILPENLGYKEFAQAVATILKDEYGSHNFKPFMELLHAELGMEDSLNEEAEKVDETIEVGDIVSKKYASTDEDYIKEFKVISIKGMRATLQDTKTGEKTGIALSDLTKTPKVNEQDLEEETGYSKYLTTPENPKGKTQGLTPDTMHKILNRIATMKDNDEVK